MGKDSVSMEKNMSAVEVASFLESIIASLKEGKVVIQQGTQCAVLKPEKLITVEIEASQKMDKGKLSIELKWKQPEADILVSSIEPDPIPEPEPVTEAEPEEKKQVKTPKAKAKKNPGSKKKAKK